VVDLTTQDLLKLAREVPESFSLKIGNLGSEERIQITKILRLVPGKRITAKCLWRGKTAVVKLFYHPKRWRRNHLKDAHGISVLLERDILSPSILENTYTTDNQGGVLITECLEQGDTLNCCLLETKDESEKYRILKLAVLSIADCHRKGVWQSDIHLNNFFISNSLIYFLDGGDIKADNTALREEIVVANLALFFAQLNISSDKHVYSLLDNYEERAESLSKSARMTFSSKIKTARIKRLKYLDGKLYRSTTANRRFKEYDRLVVHDRKLQSEEVRTLVSDPEKYIREGIIIKAGNASTVTEIFFNNIECVLKRYNVKTIWHSVKYLFKASRASRSWRNAFMLNMMGISTPHPYLFYEERNFWFLRRRAFFLSEKISAPHLLDLMLDSEFSASEIKNIIASFKELFQIMVYYQVSHGDMKATNFIFHKNKLFVLDLDAMKRYRNRNFYRKAILKDLDRFMKNWHGKRFESEFEKLVKSIEIP